MALEYLPQTWRMVKAVFIPKLTTTKLKSLELAFHNATFENMCMAAEEEWNGAYSYKMD